MTLSESMNPVLPLRTVQDFERRLKALLRNAGAAARYTYTWETIKSYEARRPQLSARLKEFVGFWNTILSALQTSAIVALGRMYDKRSDVLSAAVLLDCARTNQGLFSLNSLRSRVESRLTAPADVESYINKYRPPKRPQFDALTKGLENQTKFYEKYISPIRNNVFAHAGDLTQEEQHDMLADVPMADFEQLTVFPLCLYQTLWQTYYNGLDLVLTDAPTDIVKLLATPLGRSAIGMEHQHAVRDATVFLESLTPTNVDVSGR